MPHHPITSTHTFMMGCNITKFGSDGAKFPAKLRPLVVERVADMRAWRLPLYPNKDTPSQKALLLHGEEKPSPAKIVMANIHGLKVITKSHLRIRAPRRSHVTAESKSDKKLDSDSDSDEEFRTIGAFPGSPSFRVFFQDARDRKLNGAINDAVQACESAPSEEKKAKKEGRRRHIRRAMSGRGREAGLAVKNLMNVKACYHPSHNNTLSAAERRKLN